MTRTLLLAACVIALAGCADSQQRLDTQRANDDAADARADAEQQRIQERAESIASMTPDERARIPMPESCAELRAAPLQERLDVVAVAYYAEQGGAPDDPVVLLTRVDVACEDASLRDAIATAIREH